MNNATHPKVSVVICTYNQQAFIRETLDSVVGQTYPNLEIIVTDDGSTDDTPRILQEYAQAFPDKVKIILSEQNTGIPANLNRGLARRTGELTAWLDGDDLMLPQKIEKQVAFLRAHPEATGCYHDSEVFDSETGQVIGRLSQVYNGSTELKQGALKEWVRPRYFFIPSAIMCRSSACPSHGYDERLKHVSEVLFFIETFRNGVLLAIDEVLARYRRHPQNVSGNPASFRLMREYELMLYAILDVRYPELHSLVRKLRASCLIAEATQCFREGDRRRGQTLIKNVMYEGGFIKGLLVLIGLSFFKRQLSELTVSSVYSRPSWFKRLSRRILEH